MAGRIQRIEKSWWSGGNRFRLMLTLELAVMLPAAVLIYVNLRQLKSIERDKVLESAFQHDFDRMLAVSEETVNDKMYALMEDIRRSFPSPDTHTELEEARELELILSRSPWLVHVYRFDADRGFLLRSQPGATKDRYLLEEREHLVKVFGGWFAYEGTSLLSTLRERRQSAMWDNERTKRSEGQVLLTHAIFALPGVRADRVVVAGATFDPGYIAHRFFPQALEELTSKNAEGQGNPLTVPPACWMRSTAHETTRVCPSRRWVRRGPAKTVFLRRWLRFYMLHVGDVQDRLDVDDRRAVDRLDGSDA